MTPTCCSHGLPHLRRRPFPLSHPASPAAPSLTPPLGAPQWLIIEPTGHCGGGAITWPNATWGNGRFSDTLRTLFQISLQPDGSAATDRLRAELVSTPRVTFWVGGSGLAGSRGNFWSEGSSLPRAATLTLYTAGPATPDGSAAGRLVEELPAAVHNASFAFDPSKPMPTWGGNNLIVSPCGPQDQRHVENGRSDFVRFSSDPQVQPRAVVGNVTAQLWVR